MRLAVLTVSPKIEYLGVEDPIMPAVKSPELSPSRTVVGSPSGRCTDHMESNMSTASEMHSS
eukprot:CAMPEP_0196747742 /NCGR_PEP_ID=MMETSP1091-20130531/71030_1 /TAXON_ID=302021 /ORGANISM="Rhodomonas sp., Strain CCMP768" /LENGTH=61 /DNA_ID=CAMNT_0042094943 /DNA_START=122 /DNA_END=304 /DNA_ORIENTATION=+